MSMCCSTRKNEKDIVQNCFVFPCENGTRRILWEAQNLEKAAGTFVITAIDTCAGVRIFINGDTSFVAELLEGEAIIFTADPLELIEIECRGSGADCKVNLCLTVNYEVC